MNNDRQKALEFLREKKGWLKKGPLKLQKRLQDKRIYVSLEGVRECQAIVRAELKNVPIWEIPLDDDRLFVGIKEEPPMKIKSKWTLPGGGYGYSYVTDTATESQVFNEEAIKAYIEKNVKISPISAPLASNSFMLSVYTTDKHIGAETARNSLYSNNYDREEIFDRHEKLVEKLLHQKKMFGSFEKCIFWDLGDALDGNNGQTTRGGHQLQQNMNGREQIDTFIEVTIQTIEQLIEGKIANEIWFIATSNDNHCFSEDTEVLTNNGWKLYHNLNSEDLVANKDMVSGEIVFDSPLDYIFNETVSGKLHFYENKNINLLVTDQHRMLYKRNKYHKTDENYEFLTSQKLKEKGHGSIKFQTSGINLKEEYPISDDLIRFTAWVLTDGTITKYKENPCGYIIYQAKENTKNHIRDLLTRMNLIFRESIKKPGKNIVCGKVLVNEPKQMTEFAINKKQTGEENLKMLMSVINDKTKLPDWLFKLSKRQFDIFLKEYILGDGNIKVSTSATIHGKKEILDQLQILCILNETKANLLTDNRGNHLLSVTYNKTEATFRPQKQLKEADYNGYTWCLTMPHSNLVVRRNGRTSIQGNSGSFSHGALRSVQLYLEAKYPHIVKTFVTAKMLDHITFGKHTFIFGHGKDDSDMKTGLPLNLDQKTELFINDYIDRKCIRTDHIHVIKGDLHQSSVNYGKRFRYVNNMSMYGSSKWIHTNFGSGASGVDFEIVPLNGGEPYRTRIVYQHDC